MWPSVIATSAVRTPRPVPSTTVPPLITRSCTAMPSPTCALVPPVPTDGVAWRFGCNATRALIARLLRGRSPLDAPLGQCRGKHRHIVLHIVGEVVHQPG